MSTIEQEQPQSQETEVPALDKATNALESAVAEQESGDGERSPNTNDKTSRYIVMVSEDNHPFESDPMQVLADADWQYVDMVTITGNGGQRDARRRAIENDEVTRERVEKSVDAESGPWFLALPHSSVKPKAPRAEAPRRPRIVY